MSQVSALPTRRWRAGSYFFPCSLVLLFIALFTPTSPALARISDPTGSEPDKNGHGVLALEGEFVHNVGELQMNITNFGLIGSEPGGLAPHSDAPSAMWPAGSGVEYLWAAGFWIGALRNGEPLVSTSQFEEEFSANTEDPIDTVYTSFQGATGGARYPDPAEDDDDDGSIDEDPINGLDDDDDGLIDEDFAAIGNQYFRCVMRDDTALAQERFPAHNPLGVQVVQESFQWEADAVDDFVGFRFTVTNVSTQPLQQIYLGFFADCDIGPRGGGNIAGDDLPGFFAGAVRSPDASLVPLSVAYMYDDDGDGGLAPGFIGILFLNHPTDPSGVAAPPQVGITSFQTFSRNTPFDRGGDPGTDAERYELLSRLEIDTTPALFQADRANDFRILLAAGPFAELEQQEQLVYHAAIVVGEGERGLFQNAMEAALAYYGGYFDRDADPDTGRRGREIQICAQDFGPPNSPNNPIFSVFVDCFDSIDLTGENPPTPIQPEDLDENGCIFINGDCDFEERRGAEGCEQEGLVPLERLVGCTGIEGREYFVPWLIGLPPRAPSMRLWPTDNRVHLFWNSLSELVPDVRLQEIDFESYQLWRAEGWDRPFGSSIENGPESDLWQLIAEFDVVDSFHDTREVGAGQTVDQLLPLGPNTGLTRIRYVPQALREGTEWATRVSPLRDLVHRILSDEELGLTVGPTIPPESILRYRDADGNITPAGLAYPELAQWQAFGAEADTFYWDETGVEFYEHVDRNVHNGIYYFYSVTATDFDALNTPSGIRSLGPGLAGDPQSNFAFAQPVPAAQSTEERARLGQNIYVVPNPATREAMSEFSELHPNSEDPTGVRVMFANLPRSRNQVRIYTLSGDHVVDIAHDGRTGDGAAFWNLVSRNGQEVVSGVYLYAIESDSPGFDRVIGRFVVVR